MTTVQLLAVCLLVQSTQEVQLPSDAKPVKLPLLVRRFVDKDVRAFCVGKHKGSDFVLAAYGKDKRLRVAFGKGRGGKVVSTALELSETPRLRLFDLDGDGVMELLVVSDHLTIYSIREDRLAVIWTSKESFNDRPAARLSFGDFDADGQIDIALLNYKDKNQGREDRSLYLYLQDEADLRYRPSDSITLTDKSGYHSTAALVTADFNGDGRLELAVGNDNGVLWMVRSHGGRLKVTKTWKVPAGGAIGPGLGVGNVVPGKRPELLVGTNGGEIFVYGFDASLDPTVLASGKAGRFAYSVQSSDLDGDGLDEFLLVRGTAAYARMNEGAVVAEVWGIEGQTLSPRWRRSLVDFERPALRVQDFNGDGRTDFVLYSPFGGGKPIEVFEPIVGPRKP